MLGRYRLVSVVIREIFAAMEGVLNLSHDFREREGELGGKHMGSHLKRGRQSPL